MNLIEFLFHSHNVIFTSAIILMLLIAFLEGVLVVIGMGLSDIFDSLIPDFDSDIELDMDSGYSLTKFFGWIRLKQVPILMLLVIFLTSFGLIGLLIQAALLNLVGVLWFEYIVVIPAFIISIFSLRVIGGIVAKLLPKDETSSISNNDLIGHIAIITLGKATKGSPAEAKTQDKYGQTHYFMVEPESKDETFLQGDKVLLSEKKNTVFYATKNIPETLR